MSDKAIAVRGEKALPVHGKRSIPEDAIVSIPAKTVIQYIRDKKGVPYGVLVAIKGEDRFILGHSICHKSDRNGRRRFVKSRALGIALDRAMSGANFENDEGRVHSAIEKLLPSFLDRCRKYYKIS